MSLKAAGSVQVGSVVFSAEHAPTLQWVYMFISDIVDGNPSETENALELNENRIDPNSRSISLPYSTPVGRKYDGGPACERVGGGSI